MRQVIPSVPTAAIILSGLVAILGVPMLWMGHDVRLAELSVRRQKIEQSLAEMQLRRDEFDGALLKLSSVQGITILSGHDLAATLRAAIASTLKVNILELHVEQPLPQLLPRPWAVASIRLHLATDHLSISEIARKLDTFATPIRFDAFVLRPARQRVGPSQPDGVPLELIIQGKVLLSTAGGQ